jgi:hypothetical protein
MRPPADVVIEFASGLLEREAMEFAFDRLAPLFEGAAGHDSALFLASPDAGTATALRFWSDAQRNGVALANPELFPWCLANAPCASLARRFGITGPNATWLGDDDALDAAWSAAESALRSQLVGRAFIVDVCFGSSPGPPGRLNAWCVRAAPSPC